MKMQMQIKFIREEFLKGVVGNHNPGPEDSSDLQGLGFHSEASKAPFGFFSGGPVAGVEDVGHGEGPAHLCDGGGRQLRDVLPLQHERREKVEQRRTQGPPGAVSVCLSSKKRRRDWEETVCDTRVCVCSIVQKKTHTQ
jgi:hypothetical protein